MPPNTGSEFLYRRSRREFLQLSAALAGGTVLAGCGSSDPDHSSGGSSSGEPTGEIRFSTWFGPGDIEIWEQVISNFEKANPDITVNFEPLEYTKYFTKLNTEFAAGNAPDVYGLEHQMPIWGSQGQLEPLDSRLTDAQKAMIVPSLLTNSQGDGVQYALPWRFVAGSVMGNLTLLDQAGIAYPDSSWTLDDYVSAAKEMTTGDVYGLGIDPGEFQLAANIASTFGATPLSEDNKTATYNTPEMSEYKSWMRDLIYTHKVAPQPKDLSTQADPFASGQVAMMMRGSWLIPTYRTIDGLEFDILPNPTGASPSLNYAGADNLGVYGRSRNKEAAWKFLEYVVFDTEAQSLLGTTGAPVLLDTLQDSARIEEETAKGPEHYEYQIQQAVDSGAGWAFAPSFNDIYTVEHDATLQILSDPDANIPAILEDLNNKVQALL